MSLSIGVIYCCYQSEDLIERSLTPWIAARATKLGGHTFTICAVSVPFEGFDHGDEPRDRTRALLGMAAAAGDIDHAIVHDKPMTEVAARGAALTWLVGQGVDTTIMVDADEIWTEAQMMAVFAFVAANPWVAWFRVPYKQLVFTPQQYLAEPFTPPRIHRVVAGGYTATAFYEDNGVLYRSIKYPDHLKRDADLASLTVPQSLVWVEHETWVSGERARRKCRYQQLRWAPPVGAGCSFAWDEAAGKLIWNEEHFRLTGQPIPEVLHL